MQSFSGIREQFCGGASAADAPSAADAGFSITVGRATIREINSIESIDAQSSIDLTATTASHTREMTSPAHRKRVRNAAPVDKKGRGVPQMAAVTRMDRVRGQCCLFWSFLALVWANVLVFGMVPLYSAVGDHGQRDLVLVRSACQDFLA